MQHDKYVVSPLTGHVPTAVLDSTWGVLPMEFAKGRGGIEAPTP